MSNSESRRAAWLLACAGVIAIAIGRALTVVEPGAFDNQLFAYMGARWADGARLYLDVWDNKPPGIFVVGAFAAKLSADPFVGFALLEFVFALAAAAGMVLLLRACGAALKLAAGAGALTATLLSLSFYNEGGGHTELFTVAPSVFAMYFFVRWLRGDGTRHALYAGLCVGLGLHFKLPALAPLLAIDAFLLVLVLRGELGFARALRTGAVLVAGLALAWVPACIGFGASGALRELLDVSFLYPFAYGAHSQTSLAFTFTGTFERLLPMAVPFLLALLIAPAALRFLFTQPAAPVKLATPGVTLDPHHFVLLGFAWLAADLAGATAGGRGYLHYYLALAGSVGFVASLALGRLFANRGPAKVHAFSAPLAAIALALAGAYGYTLVDGIHLARRTLRGEAAPERPGEVVAGAILERAAPGDTLFVWDYLPLIHNDTGLVTPSRFTTALNLADSPEIARRIGRELLDAVKKAPPRFIVIDDKQKRPRAAVPFLEELRAWMEGSYAPVLLHDSVTLYERVGSKPSSDS